MMAIQGREKLQQHNPRHDKQRLPRPDYGLAFWLYRLKAFGLDGVGTLYNWLVGFHCGPGAADCQANHTSGVNARKPLLRCTA
jgi:hypothetical protein